MFNTSIIILFIRAVFCSNRCKLAIYTSNNQSFALMLDKYGVPHAIPESRATSLLSRDTFETSSSCVGRLLSIKHCSFRLFVLLWNADRCHQTAFILLLWLMPASSILPPVFCRAIACLRTRAPGMILCTGLLLWFCCDSRAVGEDNQSQEVPGPLGPLL